MKANRCAYAWTKKLQPLRRKPRSKNGQTLSSFVSAKKLSKPVRRKSLRESWNRIAANGSVVKPHLWKRKSKRKLRLSRLSTE